MMLPIPVSSGMDANFSRLFNNNYPHAFPADALVYNS